MMVNRYEIRGAAPDGNEGPLLAFAQQKRMKLREEITFYDVVDVPDPRVDFRVAASMAVALDALQSR